MEEFVRSMAFPFLACLALAGIHIYLGLHVVARKVIFVDLALAQIAALGAVYAVLLGYDLHSDPWMVKGFSLTFAVVGAAVFAITRERRERVPHEAVIGITYAFAVAATLLASTKLPHGADEMRELLTGSILWIRGDTLAYAAALYAAVGLVHYLLRRRFLLITLDPAEAERRGMNVRRWDFLFYVLFGVVVTNAVAIAGVLLVFAYLVIPATVAVLFAESVRARLMIGWAVGAAVSFAGVILSYTSDLPSGPVIVVSLALFLAVAAGMNAVLRSPHRGRSLLQAAAVLVVAAALSGGSLALRKNEDPNLALLIASVSANERLTALQAAAEDEAAWEQVRDSAAALLEDSSPRVRARMVELVTAYHGRDLLADIYPLLSDEDDTVRERSLTCVKELGGPDSAGPLAEAASGESDDFLKLEMAQALAALGDQRAIALLDGLAADSRFAHVREEAKRARDSVVDPRAGTVTNAAH